MDQKYTEKLEEVIKQMLTPLKGIPLNLVIDNLSGYKIIPFNIKDKKDKIVLNKLIDVARISAKEFNKNKITRSRANEIGNDIEPFVKKALNNINYKADIPTTKSGKKKSTGYPDIEFTDEFGRANYLECKTFNIKNIYDSQRTFYLSPSKDFKIIQDAHHFLMSFEMAKEEKIFTCKSWKILTLEDLDVDMKHEFNADNKRLYSKNLIIAQEKL